MVNDLAKQYATQNKPALFIEHDVDRLTGQRSSRWWRASGRNGSAQTPMTMVDSGFKYTEGAVDFRKVYSANVDAALRRPAGADITAFYQRSGDTFQVQVDVTNRLGVPLEYDNYATLHVLLFEDKQVVHVDRAVRASTEQYLEDPLDPGATAHFEVELAVDPKTRTNYAKSHVLVLLDYRPAETGPYDMLQASLALAGLPTPTPPPSPSPLPTATEEPTSTPEPTPVPTEAATLTPPEWQIYLPTVTRQ